MAFVAPTSRFMAHKKSDGWSRDELLARYEYGVWLFLAVIGAGTLSLMAVLAYELLLKEEAPAPLKAHRGSLAG
jgi:hypothetical protein